MSLVDLCFSSLTGKQKTALYELDHLYPGLEIEHNVTLREQELKSQLCDEIDELYWDQLVGVYRKATRAQSGCWELPNVKPSRLGQSIWIEDDETQNPYSFYIRPLVPPMPRIYSCKVIRNPSL